MKKTHPASEEAGCVFYIPSGVLTYNYLGKIIIIIAKKSSSADVSAHST